MRSRPDVRARTSLPRVRTPRGIFRGQAPSLLGQIIEEIEAGMPNEGQGRLFRNREARDFYNFDGQQHMSRFLNDAETAADYIRRTYRASGLTRGMVDLMCEHLYAPGPHRTWEDPRAGEFLERVYLDNHIDALMQRADVLSTLMDVAAIQIDAAAGAPDNRPITLRLWGGDEFVVWHEPGDRLNPFACVTIDRFDLQTRYRLWTADEVRTFITARAESTAGGRVAYQVGPTEENPYGRIPFSFFHYALPVNDFYEVGVGEFIKECEIRVNDRLSRLDQAISKHMNPIPILTDAPDNAQFLLGQPNLFLRLNRRAVAPGPGGDFGGPPPVTPSATFLEAHIDITGIWDDLRGFYNLALETARIPQSAWRMEQTGVASGIALIVEQAPLLARARRRHMPAGIFEEDLARAILECAGAFYRHDEWIVQARTGHMLLGWPIPTIPIQTDDWLNLQLAREAAGLTSKIMITMETYGIGREQAIAILEQVKEDRDELARLGIEMPEEPEESDEPGDDAGDDEGDEPGEIDEDDDTAGPEGSDDEAGPLP